MVSQKSKFRSKLNRLATVATNPAFTAQKSKFDAILHVLQDVMIFAYLLGRHADKQSQLHQAEDLHGSVEAFQELVFLYDTASSLGGQQQFADEAAQIVYGYITSVYDLLAPGCPALDILRFLQTTRMTFEQTRAARRKEVRMAASKEKRATQRADTINRGLKAIGLYPDGANAKKTIFVDVERKGAIIPHAELVADLPDSFSGDLDPDTIPPSFHPLPTLFETGFVSTADLKEEGFTCFHYGSVYFMQRAADGKYHFVGCVKFCNKDELSPKEIADVELLADWFTRSAMEGYQVKNNKAQNADTGGRQGEMICAGWRPGRGPGDCVSVYVPREDIEAPDGYVGMYLKSDDVRDVLFDLQRDVAPNAANLTSENLKHIGVPIFGNNGNDFKVHKEGLGSNLAFSRHDAAGRGFGNGMHTDRDIDATPLGLGRVFTTGAWLHADKEGKPVWDIEAIRAAIDGGYFVFPDWKIAIDLGGAPLIRVFWRGGVDRHGTSTSTVDLGSGITRWGSSCQTNQVIPTKLENAKGRNFDLYDRLMKVDREYSN